MEAKTHHNHSYSARGQADLDRVLSGEFLQMNGNVNRMLRQELPEGQVPHVCIVGAGFAGLRCAEILTQKGMKVTILEGRDRTGGRVSGLLLCCSKAE